MPAKRLRLAHSRSDVMTEDMSATLVLGFNPYGRHAVDPFIDDDHRREIWMRHREQILKAWDLPGRRPHAFWQYDARLERNGAGRWIWPQGSEAATVRHLIETGKLASCRFNGIHPIDDELAVI
jgi:hypothetical protein